MTRKKVVSKNKAAKKKKFPWVLVLIAAAAAILLPAAGFGFAASQEAHDSFCGSCHTEPESTYLARSVAAQPSDLASYHTTESTRCIDCHSGIGITGRMQAEILGASNAIKMVQRHRRPTGTVDTSNQRLALSQVPRTGFE